MVKRSATGAMIWLRLLLASSIIVPLSVVTLNAWERRAVALQQVDLQISATARLLREEVRTVLETDQLVIAMVDRTLGDLSWDVIRTSDKLRQQLRDLDMILPHVSSIMVVNPADEVANSSHQSLWPPGMAPANRQWMMALHDKPTTVVTPIYTGKVTHESQFSVGKRRTSADNHYNGAIVVSNSADFFHKIFGEVARKRTFIALVLETGEVLASKPVTPISLPTALLRQIPPNETLLVSDAAPIPGRAALQRVAGFPLIVVYAFSDTMVFDLWFYDVIVDVALALLGSSCVVLTCFIALRSYTREQQASEQLRIEMSCRQEIETKMYQSQRMEALGQLTSGVAHDFNNLLTIIIGNAEQIARSGDSRMCARANTMLTAANRGANLVARMLSFARRQILQVQPLDVCAAVQQFTPMIRASIKPTVVFEFHPNGPLICYLDHNEFELAVLNVVSNADHAMPHGGRLTIRAEMVFRDGDIELPKGRYARVVFQDTGDGMPEDVRQRVFEPFFTTRDLTTGTGLGLSQVYGFVKQTGGDVAIESELGRGTKLVMYLPMEAKTMETEKKLILIVDDEVDILEVVGPAVISQGYEAHCTDNPRDALKFVEANNVALLLTDIVMPHMTGLELARQVVTRKPQVKVVVMTGYAQGGGEYPVLRKPFRMADLFMRIRTALGETQGRWTL